MNIKNQSRTSLAAGIAIFIWASAFSGVKYCLRYYSPEAIMLLRFLVASATLITISLLRKVKPPKKEDLKFFIAGGMIGIFTYMWCFNTGTNLVTSGVSSFVIASSPIFALILAPVFLKERVEPQAIIGVIISACGLIIIAVSQIKDFKFNMGVVILMGAAICTAIYSMIQRKASEKYNSIEITTFSVVFATLLMIIFFAPRTFREIHGVPMQVNLIILLLGIFPGAIAYLAWNTAIASAKNVSTVMNFHYLTPFIASIMSFILIDEVLTPLALLGGIIIIGGMVLANRKPKQPVIDKNE